MFIWWGLGLMFPVWCPFFKTVVGLWEMRSKNLNPIRTQTRTKHILTDSSYPAIHLSISGTLYVYSNRDGEFLPNVVFSVFNPFIKYTWVVVWPIVAHEKPRGQTLPRTQLLNFPVSKQLIFRMSFSYLSLQNILIGPPSMYPMRGHGLPPEIERTNKSCALPSTTEWGEFWAQAGYSALESTFPLRRSTHVGLCHWSKEIQCG